MVKHAVGKGVILLAGGGTAGHVFKTLSVADELKRRGWECLFVGTRSGPEARLVPATGYDFFTIPAGKLRRYVSLHIVWDYLKASCGVIKSIYLIWRLRPAVIFCAGGYVGLPVAIGGWVIGVPVMGHETDAVPGLSTRIIERFARVICYGFDIKNGNDGKIDQAPSASPLSDSNRKKVYTGNPIRQQLLRKQRSGVIKRAFPDLVLPLTSYPLLLILGGSQGARPLNQLVLAALPELLRLGVVVHQTGSQWIEEALVAKSRLEQGKQWRYQPIDFIEIRLLAAIYQHTTLVIARSGGTVAEFSAFGLPALLVPLPDSAQNHQEENAKVYTQAGAAVLLKQSLLSPAKLALEAKELLSSPTRRARMSAATKKLFVPHAAERIADAIESAAKS